MKISVVIPHYNGLNMFEKTLPLVLYSLEYYLKDNKASGEIIIVDDGSEKEMLEKLQALLETLIAEKIKITLIMHKQNKGFASAVNTGVKRAKGDIVILLNTDVTPQKDFLYPLLRHFKDENIFAVGCLEKSIENGKEIQRGRGIGLWKKGFLVHKKGEIDKSTTLWVSGGSGAYRKSVWDKLKGMNELYNPFYWEDIDLSYRAQKAGYEILFEKDSIVTHEHEKGTIRSTRNQGDIKKIAYRNQFIFVWINAGIKELFFHKLWLPYHMLHAGFRGDMAFFSGFFQAFIHMSSVIQLRRRVQKQSKLKDIEITANYEKEYYE